ncbi:MAG TPA: CinA family protein [Nocardioidaceae bacterium]|nr:CinA family protein [Nocardioidaceae bacterium]
MVPPPDPDRAAADVLAALHRAGLTLAVAESVTGGMLAATLTGVPGASAVFQGAVVAYASSLKVRLLDVPAELVGRVGVVSAEVAEAMAVGARSRCGSTWAVSTTGVAGPDMQEDKPVGTVYVGWAGPHAAGSERLQLAGGRVAIRRAACAHALSLLQDRLSRAGEQPLPGTG